MKAVASDALYEFHSHYYGNYFVEYGSVDTMVVDSIVARPIGLGITILGLAVYVVSLPFSLL